MKKWILLLTLCISLLLSGCQKTPEAQPGTQPAEAPWAAEQADAPLSYEDYFAELRPYDPAENDVPDWMKDGNYEILSEDGVLALYQAANETLTRLFAYPVEAPLGWPARPASMRSTRRPFTGSITAGKRQSRFTARRMGRFCRWRLPGARSSLPNRESSASASADCTRPKGSWTSSMTRSVRMRRTFCCSPFPITSCAGPWTIRTFWSLRQSRSRPTSRRGTSILRTRAPTGACWSWILASTPASGTTITTWSRCSARRASVKFTAKRASPTGGKPKTASCETRSCARSLYPWNRDPQCRRRTAGS